MQIETLRNFIELSESGSFYRAARKLYLSQQGLNKSVTALERELGTLLVERTRRGIRLTADGEVFLGHVQRIISEYDSMLDHLFKNKYARTREEDFVPFRISYYSAQIAASDASYVKLLSNAVYIEQPFDQLVDSASRSDGSDIVFLDVHGKSLEALVNRDDLLFEPLIATRYGIVSKQGRAWRESGCVHRSEVQDCPIAFNTFREMLQLTNWIFRNHPLTRVRLGATSPRMLLECVQTSSDTVAAFDSFGFFLSQSDANMPTDQLEYTPLATDEALCFVGFLQPRHVKAPLRTQYVKDILRHYLNANCAEYYARYPVEELWVQAVRA